MHYTDEMLGGLCTCGNLLGRAQQHPWQRSLNLFFLTSFFRRLPAV